MTKYSAMEIERRWLVLTDSVPQTDPEDARIIEDHYLSCGRLRLRKVTFGKSVTLKLCKKYPALAGAFEEITNIYLDPSEYGALRNLDGISISKSRFQIEQGSLDLYDIVAIYEVEFPTIEDAEAYIPPSFVSFEVTGDPQYSGFALAQAASA